jgi:hypothetical protein
MEYETLQAASNTLFDAAMILLKSVIEILVVAMPQTLARDRPWIAVAPIPGHPIGRNTGDHLGRLEERLRGGHVAMLAEHHVEPAGATNGAIEITPLPVDLDVGLVNIPPTGCLAASASP